MILYSTMLANKSLQATATAPSVLTENSIIIFPLLAWLMVAVPELWTLDGFRVMNSDRVTVILKRFEAPDEVRMLQKGRFDLVRLGGMTIGRATYGARLEVERARRAECRRHAMPCGACRSRPIRQSDRRVRRW